VYASEYIPDGACVLCRVGRCGILNECPVERGAEKCSSLILVLNCV
jgi:hypothetical protein